MTRQIGLFFLFVGLISMVIFCSTAYIRQPAYGFCFAGLPLFSVGSFLVFSTRQPPPPSARFQSWRKYREKPSGKEKKKGT